MIIRGDEARQKMFVGIKTVADIVGSTIGPKGRNCIFAKTTRLPQVTNDGVTIAKNIILEDVIENMGAEIMKEVADYTNNGVGDGTSTATVLAHAMIKDGMKHLSNGVNVIEIKEGMKKAGEDITKILNESTKVVSTTEEIKQIAVISSQSEDIGELISNAMGSVGKDGIVTVQESLSETKVEINNGMFFESGYISPYMITDTDKMEARIENPLILITDLKLITMKPLVGLIQSLVDMGINKLVIIAEDIEGEALNNILTNNYNGNFHILGIKAPYFSDRRKEVLRDIAVITGATLISEDTGFNPSNLSSITINHLGNANEIISKKESTTISGGVGSKESIDERVKEIQSQILVETNPFQKEYKEHRLAKLVAGVAVIKVGANTRSEMLEKKLRIEDALNATRAAVSEGIVVGGGAALYNIQKKCDLLDSGTDQDIGYKIVVNALSAPFKKIVENSGKIVEVIQEKLNGIGDEYGYDAQRDEVCDMFHQGIIDPKKVTRVALETAISLSATFLTTDTAIFNVEPVKSNPY